MYSVKLISPFSRKPIIVFIGFLKNNLVFAELLRKSTVYSKVVFWLIDDKQTLKDVANKLGIFVIFPGMSLELILKIRSRGWYINERFSWVIFTLPNLHIDYDRISIESQNFCESATKL